MTTEANPIETPNNCAQATRMVSIASMTDDDPRFLALVSNIAVNTVRRFHPLDVYLTRIDHWFDYRWLAFAGKMSGALGVRKWERLTIPPFIPSRVVSCDSYALDVVSSSYRKTSASALHRTQPSRDNLNRFIDRVSESGCFLWFSGGTLHADNGSVMVYIIKGPTQDGWYASFRRGEDWRLHKVRGLSRAELMNLMGKGADARAA